MFSAVKLKGEVKRDFLQSKYAYYREFVTWAVAISVFSNITFWVSDCQLFGRLAWETLLPRTFMLLPLLGFLIATRKINTYRVMVPLAYLMLHGIMWCTIWAIYYLPIKTHASEGFIIMHLMFLSVGLCAPFTISTAFHAMVIGNIILSHQFNHYENFDLMLSLGIPCFLAIVAVNFIRQCLSGSLWHEKAVGGCAGEGSADRRIQSQQDQESHATRQHAACF